MQGKVRFWIGMALSVVGVAVIVSAADDSTQHLAGLVVAALGAGVAARYVF